jgi:hypothetical protein
MITKFREMMHFRYKFLILVGSGCECGGNGLVRGWLVGAGCECGGNGLVGGWVVGTVMEMTSLEAIGVCHVQEVVMVEAEVVRWWWMQGRENIPCNKVSTKQTWRMGQ